MFKVNRPTNKSKLISNVINKKLDFPTSALSCYLYCEQLKSNGGSSFESSKYYNNL